MAIYNMDGATINKRVANSLNEAAGKIAFKSFAADINAHGGGNDPTKVALARLAEKQNPPKGSKGLTSALSKSDDGPEQPAF